MATVYKSKTDAWLVAVLALAIVASLFAAATVLLAGESAPTSNPLSSPALSLDRLRIEYGRGKAIMISPRDKDRSLETLRQCVVLRALGSTRMSRDFTKKQKAEIRRLTGLAWGRELATALEGLRREFDG